MSNQVSVGELTVAFLEACGVQNAFGIISIHNLPIADAFGRRKKIRFVPVRNEAGAVAMADASARATNRLGVALTSTGPGCGNACGSLLESIGAQTPLLHITGNVETPYLDRVTGYTHETPSQFKLLEGASKAAFRVQTAETALGILREAVRVAYTVPMGPVTIEIPIDVQRELADIPDDLHWVIPGPTEPPAGAVDRVAALLRKAKRPMLWLGGGAINAGAAAERLVRSGIGVMSSVQGRGIIPDDHKQSLGTFIFQKPSAAFLARCDFGLIIGSRLRSAQTKNFTATLPRPLVIVDADPRAENRNYRSDQFICADAERFLNALADRVGDLLSVDASFHADLQKARRGSEVELRETLGPYEKLLDAVMAGVPDDFNWVRDITINNSSWGNRLPALRTPRRGIYAVTGGIGMGLAQSIGAAIATPERKTIALIGDGGFVMAMGEIATAVQEKADVTILLMNDGGYGIMRNLQDAHFEGRRFAADLVMPDFGLLAKSLSIPHRRVTDASGFAVAFRDMLAVNGPSIMEADMASIGPFAHAYGGPPTVYKPA